MALELLETAAARGGVRGISAERECDRFSTAWLAREPALPAGATRPLAYLDSRARRRSESAHAAPPAAAALVSTAGHAPMRFASACEPAKAAP